MGHVRLLLARPIYLGFAAAFVMAWFVAAVAPHDSDVSHGARLLAWPSLIALPIVFLLEEPRPGRERRRNRPSAS